MISIGELGGVMVVNVTHTDLDGRTRLISARAATRAERVVYLEFERGLRAGRSQDQSKKGRGW